MFFGAGVVIAAPFGVVDDALGRTSVGVDFHDTVFYYDAFAREGNDAFDDILVTDPVWDATGHGVFNSFGFVLGDFFFVFVKEDNDLTAFGYIFLTGKVRPRYGSAIYDDAIVFVKGIFHAATNNVIRTIDESI